MTTTLRQRSVVLAGLFLLALVVLAMSLEDSQAMRSYGTGGGSGGTLPPLTRAQIGAALVKHGQLDSAHAAVVPVASVEAPSGAGISATTWIVLAVALAAVSIGTWAFMRRRRTSHFAAPADAFCTRHPEDARCATG